MTSTIKNKIQHKFIHLFAVALLALSAGLSNAAVTDLGTAPLVSATTGDVLPNLMYILDNSGSMGWDYMPDYVNDNNKCKSTGTSGDFSATCGFGDPPYNTTDFNSIYYNPAITYSPGLNADGSEKASRTSVNTTGWTVVPVDAYGIQSTSNANLVTGYPDIVWCNTTSATTLDRSNPLVCKKNSQYIYPNNTGTQLSSFNQRYSLNGSPYFYTVAAGEYCTNKNLTSCIAATAPTATHTFPAKLRWCNSAARTNCQAKYLETTGYTFAKWGVTNATSATGSIKINADTANGASPVALSVTNVTVDGISIIPTVPAPALTITDTTNATQRNTLATNIVAAINAFVPLAPNPDFTATATTDVVTITPVALGAFSGTIAITTTSHTSTVTGGATAAGSITFTRARSSSTMNGINVGATVIMNTTLTTTTSGSDNLPDMATKVKNAINAKVPASGYTASCTGGAICTGATVNITATTSGTAKNGTLTITPASGGNLRFNTSNLAGGTNGIPAKTYTIPSLITQFSGGSPVVNSFSRVDIVPGNNSYAKDPARSDCAGVTCTYAEEMTNFANWYSYYRTRMQMMKTSTSRAFKTIDTRFRVGFISIANQSTNYLPIAQFDNAQKINWYNKLLATNPTTSTPLRSALTTVGRIYAGKNPVSGFTADPIQFSCQQNFAILTTDGYWNTDTDANVVNIAGTGSVGNLDGGTTPRPMFEGSTASSNSLADAAKYYYDTDLRTGAAGSAACTGSVRPNGTTGDVCENNVFVTPTDNNLKQHMTTFTLGLGVDASLTYTADYKTATEGDFYELKQGTLNWPVPVAQSQTAVDDLWHAAVNGQGTYFSAKNPKQLSTSLSDALNSIKAKVGAGAAAATSTLNPVSGDNFTYVASYTSVKWIGNLESRTVNTDTGRVSEDAVWCLEDVVADTCAAPSSITSSPGTVLNGNTTTYQCVTPGATAATCFAPGILDGTTCKVEVATSCSGTMKQKLAGTLGDPRKVYMNVAGVRGDFTSANLTSVGKNTNFENTFLSTRLSQWSSLTPAQRALVDSTSLVNFLRGNTSFEDRDSNAPPNTAADNRLYRFREATLGDLVDSTPVYVGNPKANFGDPGHSAYKTAQAGRAGTVYIGANDGMLHAIKAANGEELWAYVPTMLLDNMWKMASNDYSSNHSYYVNGDIVVNDVCTANCTDAGTAVWKTILVAGLNGGGKGYFALDITDPTNPLLLWEFDTSDDSDIGYSYGNPIVTKKADGTWVVLVTSGYNNTTGSNPGKGFLYVINAASGAVISKYDTGVGDVTTPSGFAKINAFVADGLVNNEAVYVYGGDLLGNVWRININSAPSGANPFKFAVLKDPNGVVQPITTRPELALIKGKTVVYVGTGKYLGTSDLTDTQRQSIYAISDDATGVTLNDPRNSSLMVNQVLVNNNVTGTRTIATANPVNFASGRGWYIDFPDTGERQNIPAQFVFGTLLLPTTVPSNTVCSPGGYGWLNFVDYRTGTAVAGNVVASKTNAPVVGINVLYVKGKPVVNIVTADNPTPQFPANQPDFNASSGTGFTNHRVIWRELTGDEFDQE
jgi:type IV pilus assembly protein PilY1